MTDTAASSPERDCIIHYIKLVKEHRELEENLKKRKYISNV